MNHLRNAWYVAGFSDEFGPGQLVARTLLNEPIVFFRNEQSELRALADRCPHRFAPLSAGKLCDGGRAVECPYHGLRFGEDGACVLNPHGEGIIPRAAVVRRHEVRERDGFAWLWAGDPDKADEALIPDSSALASAPEDATVRGSFPTACDYRLLVDNILDLTHADFLHAGFLGSGALTRSAPTVVEVDARNTRVLWASRGDLAPVAFDAHLRRQGEPTEQWTEVTWTAPSCMLLHVGATLLGETRADGVDTLNGHFATPETETTCHYWYWTTRDFAIDAESNGHIRRFIEHAFLQQDKPMLEAQQRNVGTAEFWSLKPVLLPGDAGAVRVRRKLQGLIAAEAATS